MFSTRKEQVVIDDETYIFRPLGGKLFAQFFKLIHKMSELDLDFNNPKASSSLFDEETARILHDLCFHSLKKSYPQEKDEVLDEFVTQHLFQLMEPLMKVNMPEAEDVKGSR